MHVGGTAVAFLLVSIGNVHGESGMRLPGSPPCKGPGDLRETDVTEWKQYIDTQVPPMTRLQRDNASLGSTLSTLTSQEQRSHFITAAYTKLCWDRVLDGGRCERQPDPSFFWSCAAAFGSFNAGTYMGDGISEYRLQTGRGTNPLGRLLARSSIAPAVRTLGDANALIFDTVGWQHFAAAKCGAPYAEALVSRSRLPDRNQYAAYWRTSPDGTPLDGSAVPRATAQLLGLEQRLIQPVLERESLLLGIISRRSMIQSGVPGAPSFDRYARETLRVPPGKVTFADFNQRFLWERDSLIPNILRRVPGPNCGGANSLRTLASMAGDRQREGARHSDTLARFPRITNSEFAATSAGIPPQGTLANAGGH